MLVDWEPGRLPHLERGWTRFGPTASGSHRPIATPKSAREQQAEAHVVGDDVFRVEAHEPGVAQVREAHPRGVALDDVHERMGRRVRRLFLR